MGCEENLAREDHSSLPLGYSIKFVGFTRPNDTLDLADLTKLFGGSGKTVKHIDQVGKSETF